MSAGTAQAVPVKNVMSVDVEDWFCVYNLSRLIPYAEWEKCESRVERSTTRLLDVFRKYGVEATFFVLGWVAERFPHLVHLIAREGHEIASHGYGHRLVYDLTPRAFREDIRRARDILQSAVAAPVYGYRAPSYSVTPRSLWALDVLIDEGFRYDASIFPIHHDRYGIPISPRHPYRPKPDAALVEAPGSTVRWGPLNFPIGGGGYFRILPYQWTR